MDYIDDHFRQNVEKERNFSTFVGIGITISVIAVLGNFLLLATILANKNLRSKWFFKNIISLCLSDLLIGCFVIPVGLDYMVEQSWDHGIILCKIYTIMDICHFTLSSSVLISICIDRLTSKLQSVIPLSDRFTSVIFLVLLLAPWFFVLVICLPVLIVGEKDISNLFHPEEPHCTFVLEESFFLPSITIMYILPTATLAVVIVSMIIVYKWRGGTWQRLQLNITEQEEESLRMTTLATWIMGIFTIIFWMPYIVLVVIFITCKEMSCAPDMETSTGVYTLSVSTSAICPWFWFILVEVRQSLESWIGPIVNKLRMCVGKQTSSNQWEYHTELLGDNEL